jgi:D-arabinose 1-dehydrogenase-like Zn-dependent alcohol dehydrogenase
MLNDWALPKMSVFGTTCAGHEGAGVIVKVGDHVKTLKPGMRAGYKVCFLHQGTQLVISDMHQPIQDTCGACELCKKLYVRIACETYTDFVPTPSQVAAATNATAPKPSSQA